MVNFGYPLLAISRLLEGEELQYATITMLIYQSFDSLSMIWEVMKPSRLAFEELFPQSSSPLFKQERVVAKSDVSCCGKGRAKQLISCNFNKKKKKKNFICSF